MKTDLHLYCETNKRSTLKHEDRVFVCHNCKAAFGHHVVWCPNCPGKCSQVTYKSYDELFDKTGEAYEWGESRLWREYKHLCSTKYEFERRKGIKESCLVYFWIFAREKTEFDRLYREYGYEDNRISSMETNIEGVYEYIFKFDGWVAAHDMVYRKFIGVTTSLNKDYIFNPYRKRMRGVTQ